MLIKIYTIPVELPELMNEEMNKFLRSHNVLSVNHYIVQQESGSYWTFCVKYMNDNPPPQSFSSKEKVDYRTVLSETDFEKFSKLRECRKAIAKEEAIPAYAVFTDSELAELVKLESLDLASVKKISGIGAGKSERYGQRIIDLYHRSHETSGISN